MLDKYTTRKNYIISGVRDEDSKLIGFTVCDLNNERYTSKTFDCPADAIEWGDKYYEVLV